MRVGFVQFAPVFGDPERNLTMIERLVRSTQADLLVLPELCTTGYQFRDRNEALSLAETADGPSSTFLRSLCAERNLHLVAGLAEKDPNGLFNSAIMLHPEGPAEVYRKVHLFRAEKRIFDPGDRGFSVFDAGKSRVGLLVCFDWAFPEAARSLSLGGAQILAHPANLVLPHAQQAMGTRCIENGVYSITANRTGSEQRTNGPGLTFTGGSRIIGPDGRVLAEASGDGESVQVVDIDPARADNKQITPENHLFEDRRPDQYRLE
jgi:predicted amidohydrolase